MLTGLRIPQVEPSPTTRERFTIGTEREAPDIRRNPGEGAFVLTSDCIPQADGLVLTRAGKRLAIRTERYTIDPGPYAR